MPKHDGPAKEQPLDFESVDLDDADDEIVDLLEVVKPGKTAAPENDSDDVDFSKDLESMLDSLSEAEKARAASFPDPTPVDHAVDHNESLAMPDMDDLDELLQSLGADSPKKAEAESPGEDEDPLPDLDAAPLAGKGKAKSPVDDEFDALLGALDMKPDSQTLEPDIDDMLPVDDILGDLDKMAEESLESAPDKSAPGDAPDKAPGDAPDEAPGSTLDGTLDGDPGDDLDAALDAALDSALDEEAALSLLDKAPAPPGPAPDPDGEGTARPALADDTDIMAELDALLGAPKAPGPEAAPAPDEDEDLLDTALGDIASEGLDGKDDEAEAAASTADAVADDADTFDVPDDAGASGSPDDAGAADGPALSPDPASAMAGDDETPAPAALDEAPAPAALDEAPAPAALDEAPAPAARQKPAVAAEQPQPRGGAGLDEVDLVELDALLDDMLASAPASGSGFAESSLAATGAPEAATDDPAPAPSDDGADLLDLRGAVDDMRGELEGLRRDLNEALALLSEASSARERDAAAPSDDLAARLEDFELTLAAQAKNDEAREKTMLLHDDKLGLLDGRVEVLEDLREQMAEVAGRISALEHGAAPLEALGARLDEMDDRMRLLEGRVEGMADSLADLDKLAAEAAARVIREELAALLTEK